jgi:hypothetical protein
MTPEEHADLDPWVRYQRNKAILRAFCTVCSELYGGAWCAQITRPDGETEIVSPGIPDPDEIARRRGKRRSAAER